MDRAVDDLLKEGIANTENEIFSEATGKDLPSTEGGPGDRSPEEMGTGHEGQLEADETEGGAAEGGEGEGEQGQAGEGEGQGERPVPPKDPENGQFISKEDAEKAAKAAEAETNRLLADPKARVPVGELISERKARQGLEKQLAEEKAARATDAQTAKSEFDKLNARIDQLFAQPKPGQQQPTTPPAQEQKNFWDDPDASLANLGTSLERTLTNKFVEADLVRQHRADGEKFLTAYNTLTAEAKTDPAAAAEIRRIYKSSAPGLEIMDWYTKREAAREIGNDPAAYRERVRAEEREKLLNEQANAKQQGGAAPAQGGQQQQAPQGGQAPRHVTRLPPSLNSAAGGQSGAKSAGGQQVIDGSDRGVFDAAFTDG